MKIEAKTYKLHILGTDYQIVSDEAESHLLQAAALVDRIMKEISSGSARVDRQKVAVLTALQIASLLLHNQEGQARRKDEENALVARIERLLLSL